MKRTWKHFTAVLALTAGCALAQPGSAPQGEPRTPAELKAYLGLTDSQVTSLVQLRQTEMQQLQPLHQQVAAKHQAVAEALQKGGATAQQLGQLLLDADALVKQIQQKEAAFRDQAVALLNADQKKKLTALDEARKLQPAIGQAVGLNLLAPPEGVRGPGPGGPGPMGGPGMGPAGMGPGMGMGMGNGPGMNFRRRVAAPPQRD